MLDSLSLSADLSQVSPASIAAAYMDRRRSAIVGLRRDVALDADIVARLRRETFRDGSISREEADALFALEKSAADKDPAWSEFFIEAITNHVVWDLRPTGVVNESQGEWLIAAADNAKTPAAFAVLVSVLQSAHRTPMWFAAAVKARAARGWPGAPGAALSAHGPELGLTGLSRMV